MSPLLGKDLYLPSAIPTVHFWLDICFFVVFADSPHTWMLFPQRVSAFLDAYKGIVESQIFNSLGGTIWNYANIFSPSYLGVHFESTQQSLFSCFWFHLFCLAALGLRCSTQALVAPQGHFSSCRTTGLPGLSCTGFSCCRVQALEQEDFPRSCGVQN